MFSVESPDVRLALDLEVPSVDGKQKLDSHLVGMLQKQCLQHA